MSLIDFYFDVISPYAYIAHKKIEKIKKEKNIGFLYKPILLGGLHKLANITAPGFHKFKLNNMKRDCELVSRKNNIQFHWNDKFPINTLNIKRGYLFASEDKKGKYLDLFFDAYWKDNCDLSKNENIIKLLNQLKIDEKVFFNYIKDQSIKDLLKNVTNEAFTKEVFGAPTFIVNNKIFWGQDRLDYALEEYDKN